MKHKNLKLDQKTLSALNLLVRESGRAAEDLVAEAFDLLFKKHGIPRDLQEALLFSLRKYPQNDNKSEIAGVGAG